MTMEGVEPQIAEWRAYVAQAQAVAGRDVDELAAHLRDQIAELDAAGLSADEAVLVGEITAPVLTMIFTPLFAVMLTVAAATYAASGLTGAFDRDLLAVFDALL